MLGSPPDALAGFACARSVLRIAGRDPPVPVASVAIADRQLAARAIVDDRLRDLGHPALNSRLRSTAKGASSGVARRSAACAKAARDRRSSKTRAAGVRPASTLIDARMPPNHAGR